MANPSCVPTSDPRYADLAVPGDNARFTPRPEMFVLATTTEEVVAAVQSAVDSGRAVAARSGGHCYENFVADPRVDVVIDLGRMNRVDWDPVRGAVSVEPGARLLDLYRTLYLRWGVTIPGGASETVAVGGHLLGGGYGPLSRRFGIASDHVHAVEVVVVDADGRARAVVTTADPRDPHHELWWGLTGAGGGNFGIVTRFWLRSRGAPGDEPSEALPRPPANVLATSRMFPREGMTPAAFRTLVGGYSRWHEHNSGLDSPYAGLYAGLVLIAGQAENDPGLSAILFLHLDGETPDAERLLDGCLAEMTAGVDAPAFDTPVTREPWLASMTGLARAQDGSGGRQKIKSAHLRRSYTDDQIDALHEHLNGPDHPFESASVSLQSSGCATNALLPGETAVSQRDSVLRALYLVTWREESADEACLNWMRRMYRDVYAETGGVPVPDENSEGCYLNFPDVDMADPRWNTSGVAWQDLYFKDNHARLQAVAKNWDPLGVFRHDFSIR
ncbi:FAD-binding oxidoreductase [Saccharopolyspora sp. 5N708]|uniref:FAD-binding oxidoreductase n=1 Tax=Saccharopolyspora sp. 5N708 TaxID=3457424 RepID=UPI003FD39E27